MVTREEFVSVEGDVIEAKYWNLRLEEVADILNSLIISIVTSYGLQINLNDIQATHSLRKGINHKDPWKVIATTDFSKLSL